MTSRDSWRVYGLWLYISHMLNCVISRGASGSRVALRCDREGICVSSIRVQNLGNLPGFELLRSLPVNQVSRYKSLPLVLVRETDNVTVSRGG